MKKLKVSVLLATRNEEDNVVRSIKSLLEQSYPKELIEIILVDNSTDKTPEIASEMIEHVYKIGDLVDISEVTNFRGAQLNQCFKLSHGDIVFFPDTDMSFDKDLISDAVEKMQKGKFCALYVPEVVVGRGILGKIRKFERDFYDETPVDAVRFVAHEVYDKVGGFDDREIVFGPDDWDFTVKIKHFGCKTGITEKPLYHHEENMTLFKYLKKRTWYFGTFDKYLEKWGLEDETVKLQFDPYYRYVKVFLEKGKWKRILKHPFLFVGIYVLKAIIGSAFLVHKVKLGISSAKK